MLAKARPGATLDIHLTYTPAQIDQVHREWRVAKKKTAFSPTKDGPVKLFKNWETEQPGFTTHADGPVYLDLSE